MVEKSRLVFRVAVCIVATGALGAAIMVGGGCIPKQEVIRPTPVRRGVISKYSKVDTLECVHGTLIGESYSIESSDGALGRITFSKSAEDVINENGVVDYARVDHVYANVFTSRDSEGATVVRLHILAGTTLRDTHAENHISVSKALARSMNNLLSKCGGAFYTAPIELPKPETVKTEEVEDEDDEEDGEW